MKQEALKARPAVVLMAHGSRRAAANAELFDLADRLRAAGLAGMVEPAFLEIAEPGIAAAASKCVARGARVVLLVPYFLSAGVHLTRDLATLRDDLASQNPGVQFVLAPALGPHPLLDELVRLRITDAAAAASSIDTAAHAD